MSSVESPRLNEQAEIQLSPPRKSAHFEVDSDDSDVEPEDISSTNLMHDYASPLRPTTTLTPHVSYIRGWNQTWKIVMLTICLAGLQFTWSLEMAYGTPYLLSLGLSKSMMSLVWIAGPLSGLIMQPVVGALSDKCTSRWGRRRPFLVAGSVVVICNLFTIGWTRDIIDVLVGHDDEDAYQRAAIGLAITSIYVLDFAINCVQASCRAILVDALPPSQQESGTAWAGRMVGIGSVAGYFMGYADLVRYLPFFGNTQLKVLCVVAIIVLVIADAITCFAVKEIPLTKPDKNSRTSSAQTLMAIARNIWELPAPIQKVCNVQLFAWMGWFPFLFYSTTYVADIYHDTVPQDDSNPASDRVGEEVRAGSFAFLIYSLISLATSFILPLMVTSSYSSMESRSKSIDINMFGKKYSIDSSVFKVSFLTLPRAWTISHFIFCFAMLLTFFASNVAIASILIGICGISWSVTMWAPFSLLGEYIAHTEFQHSPDDDDLEQSQLSRLASSRAMASTVSLAAGGAGLGMEGGMYQLVETAPGEDGRPSVDRLEMDDLENLSNEENDSHVRTRPSTDSDFDLDRMDPAAQDPRSQTQQDMASAGVILGIHNMYIVLPQFLVTFLSSILFHFIESSTSHQDTPPNAIGVVLRVGAIMTGIACYLSTKIRS
ncbi:hypothetical protein INT43_006732 [Umbelopsis isabellina]|uniref:General alpha-glucoside permease n=1 Tax=Mortierella isabellina TaxID=91625 RepID=A0A8H7Q2Z9_MORIS|nr:hypothetical protein INT43_006732 [Umbelopsis isabellina]